MRTENEKGKINTFNHVTDEFNQIASEVGRPLLNIARIAYY